MNVKEREREGDRKRETVATEFQDVKSNNVIFI